MLTCLAECGFVGASVPVGIDPDGRERLVFIPGEVATPPYPVWAQSDAALGSISRLLRRMHDVATTVSFDVGATWSSEMADVVGGEVFCHNDVCLENVVFRDGVAVGLLDFDFAAPGRRVFDLASFARMCVPIDDDEAAARLGWSSADRPGRLRLVCDEYGLDGPARAQLLACLDQSIAGGGEFVRRPRRGRRGGVHRNVGVDGRPGTLRPSPPLVGRGSGRFRRGAAMTRPAERGVAEAFFARAATLDEQNLPNPCHGNFLPSS